MGKVRKASQVSMVDLSDSDDENFDKLGKHTTETQRLKSGNGGEVAVLSPDPLVREFLQGILSFQGFQSRDVSGCQDSFWNEIPFSGQILFVDGLYFGGSESDQVLPRLQDSVQKGVYFLVLADQSRNVDFAQFLKNGTYQILWKPLDYRKIGQAMAQVWSR